LDQHNLRIVQPTHRETFGTPCGRFIQSTIPIVLQACITVLSEIAAEYNPHLAKSKRIV